MTFEEYDKVTEIILSVENPYEGAFHAQFSHGFEVCRQDLQEKIEELKHDIRGI